MINFIVMDFDGTIADTRAAIINTFQYTLAELGISPVPEAALVPLIGLPLREIFAKGAGLTDESEQQKCIDIYRANFDREDGESVQLYPGVRSTLARMKTEGMKLAVASSRGRASLLCLIEKLGIAPMFSCITGEEDVKCPKPAPDMLELLMDMEGYRPQETVMIGDTTFDILMGKSAGVYTCGVSYGNQPAEQLWRACPDIVIDNFYDLPSSIISF